MRKSVKSRKLRKSRKSVKSRKLLRKSVKSRKSLRKRLRKMNDGTKDKLGDIPDKARENVYKFLEKLERTSLSSTNSEYRKNTDLDRNFNSEGSIDFINFFYKLSHEEKNKYMDDLKNSKISLQFVNSHILDSTLSKIENDGKSGQQILSDLFKNYFNKKKSKYSQNTKKNSLIHTLDLSNCDIKDVSEFGGVTNLNLNFCKGDLEDVSALGGVHTLDLSYCRSITDVSALGGVNTLDLSGCEDITNVSNLGGVTNLNLSRCRGIKDVSNLGGVHNLNLSYCSSITDTDVSKLTGVTNLIREKLDEFSDEDNIFEEIGSSSRRRFIKK